MAEDYPDYTLPVVHVGAITVEGSVSVLGTVEVKGAVTVSGTVSVEGTVTVTGSVTVSGTVSISGIVEVTGSVTVSGTVSIDGLVAITGTVSITGAVNIKTTYVDNIVIDKLTVGAYTEDRRTLSNNGATPSWDASTGNNYRGKFFPRGCRGFLSAIEVNCKDAGAAGGTITVYLAPFPGMGYVATADVTVPAEGTADWRSATFKRMWNYDSMFIFAVSSSINIKHGYDKGTPNDSFLTSDAGATWTTDAVRRWFRAVMKGETVGDLPVSGTINVIEIPSTSSGEHTTASIPLPNAAETTVMTVPGAGYMDWIVVNVSHNDVELKIYCDGTLAFWDCPTSLNNKGITATTPGVQLTIYNVGDACIIAITLRFEWTNKLEVKCRNDTGVEKAAEVYNSLIKLLK